MAREVWPPRDRLLFWGQSQALHIIEQGLRELEELGKRGDASLAIRHPNLDRELVQDARKELLRFQKALERILPPKEWKRLGLATGG